MNDSLNIGSRLRTLRLERNLTLEQAAALCKVSKPMIGQIERGLSSPTVNTLWKLATGLKVPLSLLFERGQRAFDLRSACRPPDLREEEGAMRVWTLFPFDPSSSYEVFQIELDPGCIHRSPAHQSGVQELVLMKSGQLRMEIDGQSQTLRDTDSLRFGAAIPHSYSNPADTPCLFYNVIFYGGDRHV